MSKGSIGSRFQRPEHEWVQRRAKTASRELDSHTIDQEHPSPQEEDEELIEEEQENTEEYMQVGDDHFGHGHADEITTREAVLESREALFNIKVKDFEGRQVVLAEQFKLIEELAQETDFQVQGEMSRTNLEKKELEKALEEQNYNIRRYISQQAMLEKQIKRLKETLKAANDRELSLSKKLIEIKEEVSVAGYSFGAVPSNDQVVQFIETMVNVIRTANMMMKESELSSQLLLAENLSAPQPPLLYLSLLPTFLSGVVSQNLGQIQVIEELKSTVEAKNCELKAREVDLKSLKAMLDQARKDISDVKLAKKSTDVLSGIDSSKSQADPRRVAELIQKHEDSVQELIFMKMILKSLLAGWEEPRIDSAVLKVGEYLKKSRQEALLGKDSSVSRQQAHIALDDLELLTRAIGENRVSKAVRAIYQSESARDASLFGGRQDQICETQPSDQDMGRSAGYWSKMKSNRSAKLTEGNEFINEEDFYLLNAKARQDILSYAT